MKKLVGILAICGLLALLLGFSQLNYRVRVSGHEQSLYRELDALARQNAFLVDQNGRDLGQFRRTNRHLAPGSTTLTSFSATGGSNPPAIVIRRDNDQVEVAYISTRGLASRRSERINPYLIQAWTSSR